MKNLQEELKKFRKLSGIINEDFDSYSNFEDDESSDMNRDDFAKKMFMDCLMRIKEIGGQDYEKQSYIDWLNEYFGDTGVDNQELPY